jgi:hypothetical protein
LVAITAGRPGCALAAAAAARASGEQNIDFSDLGRLARLVDRHLGRPDNPRPKLFISEWTVPTAIDLEFNFYVNQQRRAAGQ